MRAIRWTRQFGFRRMLSMERELQCERLAKWLLALACKIDDETKWDQVSAREARATAYDLVYGRIDAAGARKRFYAIYY